MKKPNLPGGRDGKPADLIGPFLIFGWALIKVAGVAKG